MRVALANVFIVLAAVLYTLIWVREMKTNLWRVRFELEDVIIFLVAALILLR